MEWTCGSTSLEKMQRLLELIKPNCRLPASHVLHHVGLHSISVFSPVPHIENIPIPVFWLGFENSSHQDTVPSNQAFIQWQWRKQGSLSSCASVCTGAVNQSAHRWVKRRWTCHLLWCPREKIWWKLPQQNGDAATGETLMTKQTDCCTRLAPFILPHKEAAKREEGSSITGLSL